MMTYFKVKIENFFLTVILLRSKTNRLHPWVSQMKCGWKRIVECKSGSHLARQHKWQKMGRGSSSEEGTDLHLYRGYHMSWMPLLPWPPLEKYTRIVKKWMWSWMLENWIMKSYKPNPSVFITVKSAESQSK